MSIWNGEVEKINKYIESNNPLNLVNNYGWTLFHWALESIKCPPKLEIILLLLENKCSPNLKNNQGKSPFHFACINQNVDEEIITLLIQKNSNLNLMDNKGNSPFHYLCANENLNNHKMLQFFLENNADPNCTNVNGITPFHIICENKMSYQIIQLFFEYHSNSNLQDENGNTPFFWECINENSNLDRINFFLKNKANPNLKNESNWGSLKFACENERVDVEILKLLIELGENDFESVNSLDSQEISNHQTHLIKEEKVLNFYYLPNEERKMNGFGECLTLTYKGETFLWRGEIKEGKKWNGFGFTYFALKKNYFFGALKNGVPHNFGTLSNYPSFYNQISFYPPQIYLDSPENTLAPTHPLETHPLYQLDGKVINPQHFCLNTNEDHSQELTSHLNDYFCSTGKFYKNFNCLNFQISLSKIFFRKICEWLGNW